MKRRESGSGEVRIRMRDRYDGSPGNEVDLSVFPDKHYRHMGIDVDKVCYVWTKVR
jgi:hypothetical protein